jgi:hypothetical protein
MVNPPRPEPPYHRTNFGGISIACGGTARALQQATWEPWVSETLSEINGRPKGAILLRSIAHDGPHYEHKVLICHAPDYGGLVHTQDMDSDNARWWIPDMVPGLGSVAVIYWNPLGARIVDMPEYFPGFVILAHELIHARRILLGISHHDRRTEEMLTVGLRGSQESLERITRNEELRLRFRAVTENDIRAEHGLPRRTQYTFRTGEVARE